jgi:hypothetical protein
MGAHNLSRRKRDLAYTEAAGFIQQRWDVLKSGSDCRF